MANLTTFNVASVGRTNRNVPEEELVQFSFLAPENVRSFPSTLYPVYFEKAPENSTEIDTVTMRIYGNYFCLICLVQILSQFFVWLWNFLWCNYLQQYK